MRKKRRRRKKTISWKAIEYVVERKYDELPHLTAAKVARAVGAAPQSLSRAFRRDLKMRFCDFLKRSKLLLFDEMLKDEMGTKVEDLIERVDYRSYRYFKEQFKNFFGMTPAERRELHAAKANSQKNQSSDQ